MKTHQPCPDCGSSDALTIYDNGTYCFACATSARNIVRDQTQRKPLTRTQSYDILKYKVREEDTLSTTSVLKDIDNNNKLSSSISTDTLSTTSVPKDRNCNVFNYYSNLYSFSTLATESNYMNYRSLLPKTLDHYRVKKDDLCVYYPYKDKGFKVRTIKDKSFRTEGDMKDAGLFGSDLFPAGGKILTITEGENDAMAVYQMNGGYPSVSVRSATQAKKDCQVDYKYIDSFNKVYLCFDNDEPGQKALKEVASLFNPNKVFHVKLSKFKDAHEYLENNEVALFTKEWWAAKPYLPAGIVGDYSSIEEILKQDSSKPVATYPFHRLQDMTYGIRLGEVVLFTAQEKVGKTEVMRAIEYHLLTTTDYNLGIIHLEEPEKRTIQGLAGYDLNVPVHLPDSAISNKEVLDSYKKITKRDNRVYLYKHFGSDDPDVILETIRYLVVVCDCKFIFLDHITMLVTGFQGEDERKTLDYLSTHLAMLTRELNFTLFLVSHVNDEGKTRGSRNISKIADLIVHLDRDIEAASIERRNKTHLMIKGNRWAGLSGPSSVLWFDQSTFKYSEVELDNGTKEEEHSDDHSSNESSNSRPTSLWAQASREERSREEQVVVETDDGLHQADPSVTPEVLGPERVEGQRNPDDPF